MKYTFYANKELLYYQHARLPSGFGSVRFLGSRRANPYAVHPPMFMDEDSKWKRPPAICYVRDRLMGIKILALYHEGLYFDGLEKDVIKVESMFSSLMKEVENASYETRQKREPMIPIDILPVSAEQNSPLKTCIQEPLLCGSPDILGLHPSTIDADIVHLKDSVSYSIYHPVSADTNIGNNISLKEVYRAFIEYKYGKHASRRLSHSSRNASEAAYKKLKPFYDLPLDDISIVDLQNLVNRSAAEGYSRSTISDLVTLIHQLYRFAFPREMCTKEYGKYVQMPYTDEERHHQDFNDLELGILWEHKDDPMIGMMLIMCYSGFRVSAFAPENGMRTFITADGTRGYFRGGIKTKAGKDRLVPIHSSILPLVKGIVDDKGKAVYLCGKTTSQFRKDMKKKLIEIGIDSGEALTYNSRCTAVTDSEPNPKQYNNGPGDISETNAVQQNGGVFPLPHHDPPGEPRHHTPHSCRHTFSRLCESYGVNEADRRRMLGHAFGNDITNGVYGHRSVEELSAELEKIRAPAFHRDSDMYPMQNRKSEHNNLVNTRY